ncbi:MAG: hypothetical protein IJ482_01070 [Alphaproteobacteria bacterium]|nr:hypothetical protein [Alphaproteobacteria bacterium]
MKKLPVVLSLLLLASAVSVRAQSFGGTEARPSSNAAAFGLLNGKPDAAPAKAAAPAAASENKLETTADVARALEDEKAKILKEREEIFMPGGGTEKLLMPTEDKSQRGSVAILETDEKGRTRLNTNIFMYMDNFGISRSMGNMVTCNMRFVILTNLDRRLVSLDAKLVWPGITTTVSFANVPPNTPTAYNYTLMGDGCYTMDKMPNIVVNRCRVKGISAAECANKIIWLTDAK